MASEDRVRTYFASDFPNRQCRSVTSANWTWRASVKLVDSAMKAAKSEYNWTWLPCDLK